MIDIFLKYHKLFISGTLYTLGLSFVAVLIGILIGLVANFFKRSKFKILNFLGSLYVEIIRGTPLIIQMFIIKFGLYNIVTKPFKLDIPDIVVGIIAVSINSGAYVCEVIRSGINAVDKGQMEAGRSLGLSEKMTMRYIILPQAFKNILPALCNEFITVIKETAIVSYVGVTDLFYVANTIGTITYDTLTPLLITAVIYFIITFSLSKIVGKLERRLKESD